MTKRLFVYYGRSDRIRTYDPLIPNQMRYQAALRSDETAILAVPRPWVNRGDVAAALRGGQRQKS